MIEVVSTPDGLVSIWVSGKVEKHEWEQVTDSVNGAMSQHGQVSLYVDLSDLESMSPGAILEDVRFSLKTLTDLNRLGRVAVVADSTLTEKATEASSKVFSDLDAKVFGQDEEAEARRWVQLERT